MSSPPPCPSNQHLDPLVPPPANFHEALESARAAMPPLLSHQLVYDFLCLEGFPDVAAILAQEAALPSPPVIDSSMDVRARVRQALLAGDVKTAISLVNSFDPALLEESRELLLRLQLQRFVELLRLGDVALQDALAFAQETLAPLVQENPEFIPEMERCMSLLVLEHPSSSPHARLMHVSQRAELSRDLNAAILALQCKPSTSCIANIIKYNTWLKAATQLTNANIAPTLNRSSTAAAAASADMAS